MTGAADFRLVTSTEQSIQSPPVVVDLDGTLVKTNLLLESILALLREKPRYLFVLPAWLLKGKAYFKQQVTRRISLDVSILPYREEFLDYLKAQRAEGRSLVLATAGDVRIARQVADQFETLRLGLRQRWDDQSFR